MTAVKFASPAEKYLKKLKDKPLKKLFRAAIDEICDNPDIGEEKTGDLKGVLTYGFRYNKTDYRIAYTVENIDDELVVVILAGTHEGFYEYLKRYLY